MHTGVDVLNQSALPIQHGMNGDKQRGGWEDHDLENGCNSNVCASVCVYVHVQCDNCIYAIGMAYFVPVNKEERDLEANQKHHYVIMLYYSCLKIFLEQIT